MRSLLVLFTVMMMCCMRSTLGLQSGIRSSMRSSMRSLSMADVSYKVGFMFPGQGAQSVGMAVNLCNEVRLIVCDCLLIVVEVLFGG
jgi:hypothetical protein